MTDHPRELVLRHGVLRLPAFLPDATQAVVRSVDSADLERCGIEALVMNTYHVMQRPGSSTVTALGGLHRMAGWSRPIITDSGGFQAYSLIHENAKFGRLTDRGIVIKPEGATREYNLTPEKSVQLQLSYGADIVMCLDDCTHVDYEQAVQVASVERTIAWARRCKDEFERIVAQKKLTGTARPRLFAVVQGGSSHELRRQCASALLAIGFDGYGFGGWPLDSEGRLLTDIISYTRSLVPDRFPMHALGVGHPANVVECARAGYAIFDSAMPTRDARHARLYSFTTDAADAAGGLAGDWLKFIYINDDRYVKDGAPVSPGCACPTCSRYSRGYLHHLWKIGDSLFLRLATLHNLSFMAELMERLRRPGASPWGREEGRDDGR
ncbi:MAG: tRNA-ribosyltransferase family protein [Chloroflexota bacterium]